MDNNYDISPVEKMIEDGTERIQFLKDQRDQVIDVINKSGMHLSDFEYQLKQLNKKIIQGELIIAGWKNTLLDKDENND